MEALCSRRNAESNNIFSFSSAFAASIGGASNGQPASGSSYGIDENKNAKLRSRNWTFDEQVAYLNAYRYELGRLLLSRSW